MLSRARGPRRADPRAGRRRRQDDLPLRRGLELRRGGQQRPRRQRHPAQHGRHRHRHLQRPAARRRARRRPLRRRRRLGSQGFVTGLCYDPNGDRPAASPAEQQGRAAAATPTRSGSAWPATWPTTRSSTARATRSRARRSTTTAQPAGYTARPAGEHRLRRGARQRDAVRRHPATSCRWPPPWPTACGCRTWASSLRRCSARACRSSTPAIDLLRSKSLDRNSYNSGDWFNRLDFTYQRNNWGVGLPPAADNQANWPLIEPLLAEPGAQAGAGGHRRRRTPTCDEMLQIRKSSPLFRLQTGEQVSRPAGVPQHRPGPDPRPDRHEPVGPQARPSARR